MSTCGRGGARQFSIVIPFKDAPREGAFVKKPLPPAATIVSDEIAVGADRTDSGAAARFVESACRRHGFGCALTIARVEWPNAWRFHLASVVWHCYKASRDDACLVFDIDAALNPCKPPGARRAVVERPLAVTGPRALCLEWGNPSCCVTGPKSPHRCTNVREEGIATIANGLDDIMVMALRANGAHKVVTLLDIDEDSLDLHNSDYLWRQFGNGIRDGVNGRCGGRACGGRCALPLLRPPRLPRTSARTPRVGSDGPCRAPTRRHARWHGGTRSLSGLQSTNRCTSRTLVTGIAGRRDLTVKNDSAASAVSLVRSVVRGRRGGLASVRRKGIKGRQCPHCTVNVAVGRDL